MGRYTLTGDSLIEKKIDAMLERIRDEVVLQFKPRSIILHGSFARGEGSVIIDTRNPIFLSDFEITVVTSKLIGGALQKLAAEIGKEMDVQIGLWRNKPSKFYSYRIRKPTIENYELKYGSKIIYGEDYLEKMPDFKPAEISLWEGIRLMFNRMAESLKYFSINYKYSEPNDKDKRNLIYWTYKIVLACQDALLLSIKKFHYSYKIRNEMFQKYFPKYPETLTKELPELLPLTIRATNYKLRPIKNQSENAIELWFDTMEVCDKVFRYVIEKDMGFTFSNYLEFAEKYQNHPNIRKKYYYGLFGNPIYQNLVSIAIMWAASRKHPSLNMLVNFKIPWIHIVYSTIPLVYFSLSREWKVNEQQLRLAEHRLGVFANFVFKNNLCSWEYLRGIMYQTWHALK